MRLLIDVDALGLHDPGGDVCARGADVARNCRTMPVSKRARS
jgi:hypothetical protein